MNRLKVLPFVFQTTHCLASCESTGKYFLAACKLITHRQMCSSEVVKTEQKRVSVLEPVGNVVPPDYGSVLLPTYNFAAYADSSRLLQEFIKLGVELHKLEQNPEVGEFLLKLDFEKDVKPYLIFLHDNGVTAKNFGQFITKNPLIFKEHLNDLQVRVNYLHAKNFDKEMISTIITKNPLWLSTPVSDIDNRLGYFQQTFKLKGDEVRKLITQVPKLVHLNKKKILVNVFTLKEVMDLEQHSLKKVILTVPSLLKRNSEEILSSYDYITKIMKVPKYLVLKQPMVLTYRKFQFNERHKFLEALGRAQYNPLLPGYIDLLNLVASKEEEFCQKIAKAPIKLFIDFLKTL